MFFNRRQFGNGAGLARRGLALGLLLALAACDKPKTISIGDLRVDHRLPIIWKKLEPGLDFAELHYTRKSDGQKISLAALRVEPAKYQFRVLSAPELFSSPAGWVHEMVRKSGAIAAVNASFYMADGFEPTGLVVSRGRTLSPWRKGGGSGVFWAGPGRASVEWSRSFRPEWERAEAAVQAGPLLIEPDGKPGILSNSQKYEARTALGLDARGDVILVASLRQDDQDNKLSGLDLFELMELGLKPQDQGGLGLKTALNFDGGISTAMSIFHPQLQLEVRSVSPVRNGLAVELRAKEAAQGH
jgi:hypothetical protein